MDYTTCHLLHQYTQLIIGKGVSSDGALVFVLHCHFELYTRLFHKLALRSFQDSLIELGEIVSRS